MSYTTVEKIKAKDTNANEFGCIVEIRIKNPDTGLEKYKEEIYAIRKKIVEREYRNGISFSQLLKGISEALEIK